jgi:hypothetical protein
MNNNGGKTKVIIVNLNEEVQWFKQRDTMLHSSHQLENYISKKEW